MTLADHLEARYSLAVRAAAPFLAAVIREGAPVDTGALKRSVVVTSSGLRVRVDIPVQYATFVTEGTRPHPIVAKRGKLLVFFWEVTGRVMYLPRVSHPGTTANPWYRNALALWPRLIQRIVS